MSIIDLCGQELNYYSKKFIFQQSTKDKKKKISPLRFHSFKPKIQASQPNQQEPKPAKLKSFELQDQTHHNNDYNESMAEFFFDQSKQSFAEQFKCFQFQGNTPLQCETTENTPQKVEVPAKINEDSEEEPSKQVNGQQQNNLDSSTEIKKVLSEPDIKMPMSPPLVGMSRRMTEYTNKPKQSITHEQNKSNVKINKFLKRFAKYEQKGKEEQNIINLPFLGKITEKVDDDDFS